MTPTQIQSEEERGVIMGKELFITADRVAEDFGVSKGFAYRMIREMNRELKAQGYLTVSGRVSKKYYLERIYGDYDSESEG